MTDAGSPGCVRICHGVALADLGDTEGFDKDGEVYQIYAFKLSNEVYKRTHVTQEGIESLKFGGLDDVDVSYAVEKRLHTLVSTGSKWVAFEYPLEKTGWLFDIKIQSPHVVTRQQHNIRKIVNAGTRLCSSVPATKHIVISEDFMLKTSNNWQGSIRIVSEYSPQGIIGLGLPKSTIKLKWTETHANRDRDPYISIRNTSSAVNFWRDPTPS